MKDVSIMGVDLAKSVFHIHGSAVDGSVVYRKQLTRAKLLGFFENHPRCLIAMEACATAHYWGRKLTALGFEVRLIAPQYVKPFVKRQKNDAADAEAIVEAAQRPTMRFVAVKSAGKQSEAMVLKTRDLFVRQKTQTINALRGHLAEYGVIAPQGTAHVAKLKVALEDPDSGLPPGVVALGKMLMMQIAEIQARIDGLTKEIDRRARADETTSRLMTIPGIGSITATALSALSPPPETYRNGRGFAAWMGLTPNQASTGGKTRLGKMSKMGQHDLRRLLVCGAMTVIRWAVRRGTDNPWLARMLARGRPKKLIAVALANKMARTAWALMSSGEVYRAPAPAA